MQTCEMTDRNRIVKAQSAEASWHMTAKPTGSVLRVNAAFVHGQFASLPGEICAASGATARRRYPDWFTPGYQEPSAVASCPPRVEERGSKRLAGAQRDPQQCGP